MKLPWAGRQAPGWLTLAAAGAALALAVRRGTEMIPYFAPSYFECGEALLHRVEGSPSLPVSYHMPMASLAITLAAGHGGSAGAELAAAVLHAAFFLGFPLVLGTLLHSPLAGWLACAAAALAPWDSGTHYLLYSAVIAAALGAQVLWARRPTAASSAACGAAIGATVLFRSPLFLYPLVVAADAARRRRVPMRWAAVLALSAAALGAPWVAMNWIVFRRFIPFENDQATCNVVTGALGIVGCVVGNWEAFLPAGTAAEAGFNPYLFAIQEIVRHPVRYAAACAERAAWLVSVHPVLCLLGAAGGWARRKDEGVRQVILFIAYFAGIHVLMSVKPEYLIPAYYALAVLAGVGLAAAARAPEPSSEAAARRLASGAAAAGRAAILAAAAATLAWVSAYAASALARAPGSPEALAAALEAAPQDSWLLRKAGRAAVRDGRLVEARERFSALLSRSPEDAEAELELAWAAALAGDFSLLNRYQPPAAPSDRRLAVRARLLKAAGWQRSGRRARAAAELRLAREEFNVRAHMWNLGEAEGVEKIRGISGDALAREIYQNRELGLDDESRLKLLGLGLEALRDDPGFVSAASGLIERHGGRPVH